MPQMHHAFDLAGHCMLRVRTLCRLPVCINVMFMVQLVEGAQRITLEDSCMPRWFQEKNLLIAVYHPACCNNACSDHAPV